MPTIIDRIINPDGNAFTGTIKFRALDVPTFSPGGDLIRQKDIDVLTNVSGEFTTALEPGRYDIFVGERNARICISVPNDNSINYSLSDITISEVADVGAYVPGDSLVAAKDMRFSVTEVSGNELLTIPAKRQLLTFAQIQILDTSEVIVTANGEMAVIYEVP